MVHRQRGMTMQVKDPTGSSTTTGEPAKGPGLWKHIQAWDGKLSVRSGTARIAVLPKGDWDEDEPLLENLPFFPGSQVQITIPERVA